MKINSEKLIVFLWNIISRNDFPLFKSRISPFDVEVVDAIMLNG